MSKELELAKPLKVLASYCQVDPAELHKVLEKTAFKNCKTPEEFLACTIIAAAYGLNPLTGQIHAFSGKGGGVVPVVSIDGWVHMVTSHPKYDGVEFVDVREGGKIIAITTKLYVKGQQQPTSVTEYLDECKRDIDTWKKWPYRMLRHKSYIQCARIAFGFGGVYDEDEAERINSVTNIIPGKPDVEMPKAKVEEASKKEETKAEVVDAEVVEDTQKETKSEETIENISMLSSASNGAKITVKGFVKNFVLKQTKTKKDFTQITVIDSYDGKNPKEVLINCWGKKELNKGVEHKFDVSVKIFENGARNYLAEKITEM